MSILSYTQTTPSRRAGRLSDKSDSELIALFKGGLKAAFDALIIRYQAAILRNIQSKTQDYDVADELRQQTFLSVYKAITEGRYTDDGHFRNWLFHIANNKFRDYCRSQKGNHEDVIDSDSPVFSDRAEEPVEVAIEREARLCFIEQQAKTLPDNLRRVFGMRLDGIKFADIATLTSVSINTAISQYQYALRRIEKAGKAFEAA